MNKILLLIGMLSLSGCSLFTETEQVFIPTYTKVQCPTTAKLEPLDLLDIKFVKGVDEKGYKIIGLRGDEYSKLAVNSGRVEKYIINQKDTINYYKQCIQRHNEKVGEQKERGQ